MPFRPIILSIMLVERLSFLKNLREFWVKFENFGFKLRILGRFKNFCTNLVSFPFFVYPLFIRSFIPLFCLQFRTPFLFKALYPFFIVACPFFVHSFTLLFHSFMSLFVQSSLPLFVISLRLLRSFIPLFCSQFYTPFLFIVSNKFFVQSFLSLFCSKLYTPCSQFHTPFIYSFIPLFDSQFYTPFGKKSIKS